MNDEMKPEQPGQTVESDKENQVVANINHFEIVSVGDGWQLSLCLHPDWSTDLDNELRMRIKELPARKTYSEAEAWQEIQSLESALARGETVFY